MSNFITEAKLNKFIAVIRTPQLELGLNMAAALQAGGMRLIEITWNSDRPALLVSKLCACLPDCIIGVGTVTQIDELKQAQEAGAKYVFCPNVNVPLIEAAVKANIPIIPGALTPTEILNAWQAGATAVKVFPVQALGGPSYIKCLQGPLGHIPLIPTGGVNMNNAREFLAAGALCVGLSSDLLPTDAINAHNWEAITQRARNLINNNLI